jgi:YHS domain-containing protein
MGKILRLVTLLAALAVVALPMTARAGSPVNADGGLALKGYDPVSYFRGTGPQKGDPAIVSSHEGVSYRFASQGNKADFDKEPGRYLPQYGGFCAYAVSYGRKADIDPQAYAIHGGKLYVNYSLDVLETFEKRPLPFIRLADKNWPTVRRLDDVTR